MARSPLVAEQERVDRLVGDLRAGRSVRDERFDRLLASAWREASRVYWTPMDVCRRALVLLAPQPGERVLDVGSGVGKLCIVGALSTRAVFVGVEQRPQLVHQAQRLAHRLGADRALFVCRDALTIDWQPYHCLYFYNPFGELHFAREHRLDAGVGAVSEEHDQHVMATQRKLAQMPVGTRVVTFHGFGGQMGDAYTAVSAEPMLGGTLALWRKSSL
jgi:hypothetical protein